MTSDHDAARRAALITLVRFAGAAGALFTLTPALHGQPLPQIDVWKSPTCGCCNDWISHLEANGFNVKAVNVSDSRHVRARFGMPAKYGSCHTGLVGGYVVEGHVPAREIKRLLREKPVARGISVPGMPIGSPGMDGPAYGGVKDPYDVLLIDADGTARVFASYE
jgi:hypothetical protein